MDPTSQCDQDRFVYMVSGGKTNGTFLDIGSGRTMIGSNTLWLESLGWTGFCLDLAHPPEAVARKATMVTGDASHSRTYAELEASGLPDDIDYLSIDVDDASWHALEHLDLNRHTFGVATIEHDFYRVGSRLRTAQREKMYDHGYYLLCGNLTHPTLQPGQYFEDWWINPAVFGIDKFMRFRTTGASTEQVVSRMFREGGWSSHDAELYAKK